MYYYVPLSVVVGKVFDVPPVLVEESVAESDDFGPDVEPGVEDAVEEGEEADSTRDGGEGYGVNELFQGEGVFKGVFEDGDAESFEN